jgi:hypothetical protein
MNDNDQMPTSIFKHTTLVDGNHIVLADKVNALLQDPTFDTEKLKEKMEGDQFDYGLNPVLVVTPDKIKKYYTPAQKRAIDKYRITHREQYNEQMRNVYNRKREDEEWLKNRNEKAKANNKKYREKKIAAIPPELRKPRGRPKKVVTAVV